MIEEVRQGSPIIGYRLRCAGFTLLGLAAFAGTTLPIIAAVAR